MVRRVSLVGSILAVLGCGPESINLDEAGDGTQDTDESSDDGESTTQPSMLEAESESSESESSESESSGSESSDEASSDTDGMPGCGNGRIEPGEHCEGEDLDGFDCLDLGYVGGTLICDPVLCTFDASGCTVPPEPGTLCGNGMVDDDDEACDGDVAASCLDYGFAGGTLACTEPCMIEGEAIGCPHSCQLDLTDCLVEGEASPCTNDDDCPASAPHCSEDACWNGAEGDPCLDPGDCMANLGCINGECWNGSVEDPCLIDTDCQIGQCAFGHCYSGGWGSPCASNDDCALLYACDGAHYCVTL